MAYIIPNATETGSGQRYANINQAEPDSVDIEALGNRSNYVRTTTGLATTITTEAVSVTGGNVVVNGKPYYCAGTATPIPISRASTGAQIALIVARLNTSTGVVEIVNPLLGVDTATNPIFPKSKSVLTSGGTSANYDPATDVLVASIYISSAETTNANIVDKRTVDVRPITYTSATVPAVDANRDVIGDVAVVNGVTYVRVGPLVGGSWTPLATQGYADTAGLPVGSVFVWAGSETQSPGAAFLPCDGQDVLKSTYSALFGKLRSNPAISVNDDNSVYGVATTPSTHFRLPNLNSGRVPTGTTTLANLGQNTGNSNNNQVVLTQANLAAHKHITASSLGHSGTGHTTNGGQAVTQGETAPGHRHKGHIHGHQGAMMYRPYDAHNDHHVISATNHGTGAFHVDVYRVNESDPINPFTTTDATDVNEENATPGTALGSASRFDNSSQQNKLGNFTQTDYPSSAHNHNITLDAHNLGTHSITEEEVGSNTPVNIAPMGVLMRWYIKAL